ncbi:MAG: hypothetical protein SPE88_02875 [Paludibacteraceae bacterium]|nr:hypothetical protein [Paludibacteraceae bacterium]
METNKQQEFREALASSRDIFEQSVLGIDAEIKRLQEQRKLVVQDYKKRNEGIHAQFNAPTEHSIACRRKTQAYNLKRSIGGILSQWKSPVIDAQSAQVQFEMKEDHIAMSITIPFKPYEFPKH